MPGPSTIDVLDDARLLELYDEGSFARGRAYAEEGRAQLLGSSPGAIKAVCSGSGRNTYVVHVRWNGRDRGVTIDDTCTCPIGGGCKHCVAAILTARRQVERARPAPAAAGPTATWRDVLGDLVSAGDHLTSAPKGLALQFAVQHPRPSQWAPPTGPRVTMRPLRRGKGGKWIKTGASWRDVGSPYGSALDDADQLQRSALVALMASGRIGQYDTNAQGVALERFGPDVWHHLARAVEAGIALVAERAGQAVELSPTPASAAVDLASDATGAVTVTTGFIVDGDRLTLAEGDSDGGDRLALPHDGLDGQGGGRGDGLDGHGGRADGLVGTPPNGLWVADASRLRLVPLDAPLHPAVARLATAGPLTVPAGDVDELLDTYQPALARHAAVESTDGSVTIPTNRFEGIALLVDRTALDTATLRWVARYRRGERTVDHPLHHPGGPTRDRAAEATALGTLELPTHLLPALAGPDGRPADVTVSGPGVVTLITDVLPWLEAKAGIEVELGGDQPTLREADGDPLVSFAVSDPAERADRAGGSDRGDDPERNDWFDLNVEVSVDGQAVDFARLFAALDRGDDALILPSGTWLRLDRPELDRLRQLIDEARGLAEPTAGAAARLNRFQASWWDELTGLGVVSNQSQRWAASVGRMAALAAPEPVPVPAGLEATLRTYQQEGVDWLAFLHRNRLGGILADDMGLGKTVQALALALHILERQPDARFLVVAPTSVVENWAPEAARFAPGLACTTVSGTVARRGTTLDEEIGDANLVVTSYALFRLEYDAYARHDWELLLLDEAQFVKNHQGKTYQYARRLDAATKVAITGTPLENTLMDLWALLSITAPGLYPDPKRFDATYRKPIEKGDAPELLATLRRRIAPLIRRRTKDEVLAELPPKTEQVVEVELGPEHARIYETRLQQERRKVLGLVGDVGKHRFEILRSLTVLRQLALDPGLVDDAHDTVGSAKLDRLLDDLTQVVAEGHRALVFSQFTRYLARARTRLDEAGIAYAYLDGRTRNRAEVIGRFKDGDAPVFVISLKAGGFGLNLTEADYCFVLDPWWNPATETQAVDRAHRIGQQNPVMVYRYVSTGTIEEKVMALKERKAQLFTSVIDAEGALSGALTEADIRGLLDLS